MLVAIKEKQKQLAWKLIEMQVQDSVIVINFVV